MGLNLQMSWERFRCNIDCKTDPDNCFTEKLIKQVSVCISLYITRVLPYPLPTISLRPLNTFLLQLDFVFLLLSLAH